MLAAGVAAAAAKTTLPAVGSAKYDYTEGLHKTLIFFESMRSGVLDRQRLAWCALLTAALQCCFQQYLAIFGRVQRIFMPRFVG